MLRIPHWTSLAAIALAVSGIAVILAIDSLDRGEPLNDFGFVPDFALEDRSGRVVTLADLEGEVWIANLIFTHCGGTCPLSTVQMRTLRDSLDQRVRFVSITVDPNRDTPEVLARYADFYGAGPDWYFLTGERDDIYRLAREGFHLAVDDTMGTEIEPITHSTRFVLVDPNGRIRNYYDGTSPEARPLIAEDVGNLLSGFE